MGHSDSQEFQRLYRRVSHIHHQMWAVRPPKTSRMTMEETNQFEDVTAPIYSISKMVEFSVWKVRAGLLASFLFDLYLRFATAAYGS